MAGGLDRKGCSDNFVADVQANDETTQKEEENRSSEETELETQIDTSAPVTARKQDCRCEQERRR